jgi:AraC family ethanolamine operon transcriptional activator
MSNIIFPAGFIIDLPHLDMEMMEYWAKQWTLENTKLEKGLFDGSTFAGHTPRIQLSKVHYSQAYMSKGDFPNGCIVLSYSPNNVPYNFQNRTMLANEMIVMTKGDELDLITSGQVDLYTIVIEEQLFYQSFYNFFGDIPRNFLQDKRFFLQSNMISLFNQTINSWLDYLMRDFPALDIKPEYEKIELEILHQIFSCIKFTPLQKERKHFQVKNVRDLLHKSVDQDINISMLTQEFNISESQLHYAFKSNYGLTPKKYLQMLRFNAVHKELQRADSSQQTVSEIAMKYNFWHMNHFSAEYKKIFSQTPSQTLHE